MSSDIGDTSGCKDTNCPTAGPQLKLYQAFIFATPILFTFVLLFIFCIIYLHKCLRMTATSEIQGQFFPRGLFSAPSERGLIKSVREGLPVFIYSDAFGTSIEDNQCAVCLGDYQQNEKLQQLPVCSHTFHKDCIGKWLANNSTCPICRTSLIQNGKVVPVDTLARRLMTLRYSCRPSTIRRMPQSGSIPVPGQGQIPSGQLQPRGQEEGGSLAVEAPASGEQSHKSPSSMEVVVKVSVGGDHAIQIER